MPSQSDDFLSVVKTFVGKASTYRDDVYVAIDPGASGAIAFLCAKAYAVIDIPTMLVGVTRTKQLSEKDAKATGKKTKRKKGSTTKFNNQAIVQVFRKLKPLKDRIFVTLEAVPSSLGPGKRHAEILLNRAYAMWPLFLASKNYPVEEVAPAMWKKKMGVSSNAKNKEPSRHKALALFPRADILRKKDHDRAEALLLAEYNRRLRNGVIK